MAQMDGAVSYCFWEICSKKKNTGLQGSTLSGPRMTPELLIAQRGRVLCACGITVLRPGKECLIWSKKVPYSGKISVVQIFA